jgi:hypothetical protein
MSRLVLKACLYLYPRRWRERYGDEVLALAEDAESGLADVQDLVIGGVRQRIHVFLGGGSMPSLVNALTAAAAGVVALLLAAPTAVFIALNLAGQDVSWQPALTQVLPALPLLGLAVALAPALRIRVEPDQQDARVAVTVRVLTMPGWLLAVVATCALLVAFLLAYGISDAVLEAVR